MFAALAAAFTLPFTAEAAKGDRKNKKQASPAFSSVDKDGDGSITQEEYVAAMKDSIGEETAKTQFASLDKNKDGKLSKEEFEAGAAGKKEKKKKNQ
jgi:Ca2+-binding EF-hand superfamily protein